MTIWNWIADTIAALCLFGGPVAGLWVAHGMGWLM